MVLAYWKIRGLAAGIRFQLIYAGVDFESKIYAVGDPPEYNKDCWYGEKYKLGMAFPNLPYLKDGDFILSETLPIHEYAAEKWGPFGNTPKERAQANMVARIIEDTKNIYTNNCYSGDIEKAI